MSKLTVPQHINHSTLFRNWLEAINGIIDEELELYDALDAKAPKNHASESQAFGVGGATIYGHLKLSDNPSLELDATKGYAATPKSLQMFSDAFTARLDQIEEDFYANLQELRTDLQTQIDELNEAVDGKAPIYHASSDTTYGKGNSILYGHLRLNSVRSPQYGVDDGYAATPSAVQAAYDDTIAYVDSFDIDTRFETVNRRVDQTNQAVDALEERMDDAETAIEDIRDKMSGLEIYPFEEDVTVDSTKVQYGAYVFRNASANAKLYLGGCKTNIKITVSNETSKILTILPVSGCTINGEIHPIILGKNDSAAFIQNPKSQSGATNWTLTGQETAMQSAIENDPAPSVDIDMSSERAQVIEVNGTCSLNFILGDASSIGRSEYSEKSLFFIASSSGSRINWPEGIVWMNSYEAPEWGEDGGETLMVKAYQIGNRLLIEQKHNSHIVPGLDASLIQQLQQSQDPDDQG